MDPSRPLDPLHAATKKGRVWSWLSLGCAIAGLAAYFLPLAFMAPQPDPATGRVYAVIALVRFSLDLIRYGTLEQAVVSYAGAVFGVLSYAAWLLVLRKYDPAAFRKRVRQGKI